MFDKNKILTAVTADQAKIGTLGLFADCLYLLEKQVNSNEKLAKLKGIKSYSNYPFIGEDNLEWMYYYPMQEESYRPFKDALECLSFLWNNHNQVVDMAGEVQLCAVFDNNGVMITRKDGSELWSFKYMLKQGYTIAGKPFGVEL